MKRLLKFQAVGAIGIAVQFAVLAVLVSGLKWNYLAATATAVYAAIVHNFLWHERFTWADRTRGRSGAWGRFVRFNLTNGLVSISGNVALMALLAGRLRLHYVVANGIAIAACALANFLAGEFVVFRGAAQATAACERVPRVSRSATAS